MLDDRRSSNFRGSSKRIDPLSQEPSRNAEEHGCRHKLDPREIARRTGQYWLLRRNSKPTAYICQRLLCLSLSRFQCSLRPGRIAARDSALGFLYIALGYLFRGLTCEKGELRYAEKRLFQ